MANDVQVVPDSQEVKYALSFIDSGRPSGHSACVSCGHCPLLLIHHILFLSVVDRVAIWLFQCACFLFHSTFNVHLNS